MDLGLREYDSDFTLQIAETSREYGPDLVLWQSASSADRGDLSTVKVEDVRAQGTLWHHGLGHLDDKGEVESLRHEDGDGQGRLLPGLGWQVEHEDRQVEDANAGNDQIHDVEQGLPPDLQVEEDIWEEEEINC